MLFAPVLQRASLPVLLILAALLVGCASRPAPHVEERAAGGEPPPLLRDDVPAQYRSLVLARRSGRWKGRTERHRLAASNVTLDDSFRGWRNNQHMWYDAVDEALAPRERAGSARVVRLSFERHLRAAGGPALAALWRALQLEPPPPKIKIKDR